jgi:hypothetical protein
MHHLPLLLATVLIGSTALLHSEEPSPVLAPEYAITGAGLEGSPYSGKVSVEKSGDTHQITWTMKEGQYSGLGLLTGNLLSVGWAKENCNVAAYAIDEDGNLMGIWAPQGSEVAGGEQATRSDEGGEDGIEGEYTVEGTNPDGKSGYEGTLTIKKRGDVFQFIWVVNGVQSEGIGIQLEDVITVGYGSTDCGIATYAVNEDGSLKGVWGLFGNSSIGIENWTAP